jgi:hypothetical protein
MLGRPARKYRSTLPSATESKERPSETYPDGGWRV